MKSQPYTQASMFTQGEDLPLFSGTAPTAHDTPFTPKPVEIQDRLPLPTNRPYWETEKYWDSAGNCTKCGEAGRCRCKHPRKDPPPATLAEAFTLPDAPDDEPETNERPATCQRCQSDLHPGEGTQVQRSDGTPAAGEYLCELCACPPTQPAEEIPF